MIKAYFKNIFLVSAGIIVGTGLIYAVNASPEEYTYYYDGDGDGFGTEAIATTTTLDLMPPNYVASSTDCNDSEASINPDAEEVCDLVDNNCDGNIDEGVTTTFYYDFDGDLFGGSATSTEACVAPENYVSLGGDCNDIDENINPDAEEVCDLIDNNCDGNKDEGVTTTFYLDLDGDFYGDQASSTEACSAPDDYVTNSTDCDDSLSSVYPGAPEIYDSLDNDCDGSIDEGFSENTYYKDNDGDGYGDASISTTSVTSVEGYVSNSSDCDDSDSSIHPGATEIYDGIDNNCNGSIDEGITIKTYYRDADGDTYGDPQNSTTSPVAVTGYVTNNDDCNDSDADIYPGAEELDDGIDNDCDGLIDEGYDDGDEDEPGEREQYRNHGQYMSAWAHHYNYQKKIGEITGREKGQMMKEKNQEKNQNKNKNKNQNKNKGKK